MPSSVYWNGLHEWGIRLCPWPLDAYHHHLAIAGAPPPSAGASPDAPMPNWHPGLPPAPEHFPEEVNMQLRPEEAEYLRDRILLKHPGSLLGQLLLASPQAAECLWPWDVLTTGVSLSPDAANTLRHAREFSLAMHGAVLIYNLMLAEAAPAKREDWVEKYRALLTDWAEEVTQQAEIFARWDREDFWRTVHRTRPHVPERTRLFVDAWLNRLLSSTSAPDALAEDDSIRDLIDNRERAIKRAQARLHNFRLLEAWNGDTGSGTARMSFRWAQASRHLADIHFGLGPS